MSSDTWRSGPTLPSKTYYAAYSVPYDDSFLVVAGYEDVGLQCPDNAGLVKYDVQNDDWIEITDQTISTSSICGIFHATMVPNDIFNCV